MANTFHQFVAFGIDIVGLERILRGIQSLLLIFMAWPLSLTHFSSTISIEKATLLTVPFRLLQSRVGLVRRVLRTFRFIDSFNGGVVLFQNQSPGQGIEVWLDVISKTTLGMWGLLETITMLDAFEVPGLEYFGAAKTAEYNRQAQIYWFVALVASALSSLVKIGKVAQSTDSTEEAKDTAAAKKKPGKGRKSINEKGKDKAADVTGSQRSAKIRQLSIKFVSDCLDMVIPASGVGWINLDRGLVASAMLVTTFITGKDVWDRCGKELDAKAS
ncbi:hypothetical protein NLU13_7198 [Sarocladium strictum]|uniref:AoPex11B-like protein n=1 Tax=Sarocladium strictum TaxID=5046 RepID=A0AA39GCD5_SARSR|nr:hypothetical protein NLU13_7198 [Sarocladium strictum]